MFPGNGLQLAASGNVPDSPLSTPSNRSQISFPRGSAAVAASGDAPGSPLSTPSKSRSFASLAAAMGGKKAGGAGICGGARWHATCSAAVVLLTMMLSPSSPSLIQLLAFSSLIPLLHPPPLSLCSLPLFLSSPLSLSPISFPHLFHLSLCFRLVFPFSLSPIPLPHP
ncbi:unnamed protein product [Closterium sp. Naga37s-1]|nr:unnamed protein product [Closterium sp. Naga37s-1]